MFFLRSLGEEKSEKKVREEDVPRKQKKSAKVVHGPTGGSGESK